MKDFEDKIVLITGGTGSFGTALLKKFIHTGIMDQLREIRIFSRDELKQDMMRNEFNIKKIKYYIGDVRNRASVDQAMQNVNFVFHAAALKQVPSCEFFPLEAIQTNVLGSSNVIRSAIANEAEKVIMLSTDKAVYPINVMGMSKALMEKLVQAESRLKHVKTVVCAVRYGNVMCSRGSVIPLFIQQIKNNSPITVTAPEMTRFMLSLDDAVNLVIFAFLNAQHGDVFIKKAPACTVGDLVDVLKKIFHSTTPVKVIGIRQGEKIHETLASSMEMIRSKDWGDFYQIKPDNRDLNYQLYFNQGQTTAENFKDYTSDNTDQLNPSEIETLLLGLSEVKKELKDR